MKNSLKKIFKALIIAFVLFLAVGVVLSFLAISYLIAAVFGVSFFSILCLFAIVFFGMYYIAIYFLEDEEDENQQINS